MSSDQPTDSEARFYLKRTTPHDAAGKVNDDGVEELVAGLLKEIRTEGAAAVLRQAQKFDSFDPAHSVTIDGEVLAAACERVSPEVQAAIHTAHSRIEKFALAQRAGLRDTEVEISPGNWAGSRWLPVESAGCYVPGGRWAHIASALMTVTTAKAAGVKFVVATTPPREECPKTGRKIPAPAVLYALRAAGADQILCLGGVHGVAAMAFGTFAPAGVKGASVLCGPGNRFVTAAKRQLFGERNIDLIAGPTEAAVIVDELADPELAALDLVSQCEHGLDSPNVLISTSREVAQKALDAIPALLERLPEPNKSTAAQAWRDYGEVIVCKDRETAAIASDEVGSEHLEVHAAELDWWLARLQNYGGLFLGPEVTVSIGDKAFGPNHVLPTRRASYYTGGLTVAAVMKCVSWQRIRGATAPERRAAIREAAQATSVISREEGMVGHALAAEARLDA